MVLTSIVVVVVVCLDSHHQTLFKKVLALNAHGLIMIAVYSWLATAFRYVGPYWSVAAESVDSSRLITFSCRFHSLQRILWV
jgi:hypothetical protein